MLLSFSAFGSPAMARHPPPDSVELLRRARRAQRDFETIHRRHLPPSLESFGGRCDEYVGRLCLWGSDLTWEMAEEDSLVAQAREELLAELETIGRALPGDRWILGQRVRYLGDTGRWEEATELARTCQGQEKWWCHGLLGYVLHRSGDVVGALESFSQALRSMEPENARKWRDPYPLLDYAEGRWLKNPNGMSRSEAESRFWTLADPLFLTPGNERLSEHFARLFAPTLYEGTALTMGISWGKGFQQLTLRYGFVAGWEQARTGLGNREVGGVLQHRHPEGRGHLPPFEALEDPAGLPEGVWIPQDDRPRSASAPVLAPLLAQGQAQTALLRRGGNLLVLVSYGIPKDSVFLGRRAQTDSLTDEGGADSDHAGTLYRPLWEPSVGGYSGDTLAGLFLLADTGEWAPVAALGSGGQGVLQVEAPPGGYLLSVEQWDPAGRWGARVRHGVRGSAVPPDVPHLSDLLLLDRKEGVLPGSLAEAIPRLRASTEVPSDSQVAVAWEVYGLGRRREPLIFRLSVVEEGESIIRRALKRIGLFKKAPVLTLSWEEEGAADLGPRFRAVELDLPSLDPGRYVLRLEMWIPYRNPVSSNRRITVF